MSVKVRMVFKLTVESEVRDDETVDEAFESVEFAVLENLSMMRNCELSHEVEEKAVVP